MAKNNKPDWLEYYSDLDEELDQIQQKEKKRKLNHKKRKDNYN